MFDVIILRKCNLAEFIRIVTLALRGEHLSDPNLIYFQTNHIEINSPDYVQLNLDGEFGGTLPCVMTNLQSHLRVIVDESGESIYKKKFLEALTTPFQLKGHGNGHDEE
ncbi:Diacylglycerol kinase [compost metagenome]